MSTAVRALHLPGPVSSAIMTMAREGRGATPPRCPPGIDAAAIGHTVGQRLRGGLHVGLHVALWVSGIMLLVGAPIALMTIRGTAAASRRGARSRGPRRRSPVGTEGHEVGAAPSETVEAQT